MKKINERKLIREFIDGLNYSHQEQDQSDYSLDNNYDHEEENSYYDLEGHSHSDLDPDGDGIVTRDDLYNHFDLNLVPENVL